MATRRPELTLPTPVQQVRARRRQLLVRLLEAHDSGWSAVEMRRLVEGLVGVCMIADLAEAEQAGSRLAVWRLELELRERARRRAR